MNDKTDKIIEDLDDIKYELDNALQQNQIATVLELSEKWQNKKNELDIEIWNNALISAQLSPTEPSSKNIESINVGNLVLYRPSTIK